MNEHTPGMTDPRGQTFFHQYDGLPIDKAEYYVFSAANMRAVGLSPESCRKKRP